MARKVDGLVRAACVICLLLAAAMLPGATPDAHATPAGAITVTSTADTTGGLACTLRDAIKAANTNTAAGGCPAGSPGMDTISFHLPLFCSLHPCSITLGGSLLITEDLTIDGAGYNPTLDGNGANVLAINGAGTVNLSNVRIIHGTASNGGGINNGTGPAGSPATLTLTNVNFGGNLSNDGNGNSDGGGAIKQWGGTLNVINSTFAGNMAAKVGGAIQAVMGPVVTVSGSTFSSNTSTLGGGAIQQEGGTLSVSNSSFTGNTSGDGGAIHAVSGAALIVTNSTFASNSVCVPTCTFGADGGAIHQQAGPVTVSGSTFISNTADLGGAIVQSGGAAVIASSTFTGNQASLGGALLTGGGSLDISGSDFDDNLAGLLPGGSLIGIGGAILTEGPTAIRTSTFSHNHALQCQTCSGAQGGAIDMAAFGATLSISDTTIGDNLSDSDGGGLALSQNVTATLTNVTVSGNMAGRNGGGILQIKDPNSPSILNLNNVTIAGNTADSGNVGSGHGGGIFQQADFLSHVGTINIQNTILAGNFDTPENAGGGTLAPDCAGTLTDNGYNLLGRNDGCGGLGDGVDGNKVGTSANPLDPRLGSVENNGGPTLTRALLGGSPAINAGNPLPPGSGGLACAATDQRGVLRPIGPRCDMGAYEALTSLYLPLIRR